MGCIARCCGGRVSRRFGLDQCFAKSLGVRGANASGTIKSMGPSHPRRAWFAGETGHGISRMPARRSSHPWTGLMHVLRLSTSGPPECRLASSTISSSPHLPSTAERHSCAALWESRCRSAANTPGWARTTCCFVWVIRSFSKSSRQTRMRHRHRDPDGSVSMRCGLTHPQASLCFAFPLQWASAFAE